MAPKLADLPDEILCMILRNFCLHCTREHNYDAPDGYFRPRKTGSQDPDSPAWYINDYTQALYSTCLVSRRFCSVAQPLLYHDFLPGYGDSWRSKAFSWAHRLPAFLQTIIQRRDLAALVKRICVHPHLLHHINPGEADSALDNAARLANFDVTAYTAHFHRMYTDFDNVQADGVMLLGVVLALTPNLDRLSLLVTAKVGDIPALAFEAIPDAIARQKPLSRLNTLDISSYSDGPDMFSLGHQASGILEVAGPNLETLNLHMCGAANLRVAENTLHLRHLRMTQSRMNEVGFEALASACAPGLETFVYEASYPLWWYLDSMSESLIAPPIEDDRQDADQLFRHLAKFRATLKSLHFDLRSRQHVTSVWDSGCTKPLAGTDTLPTLQALEDLFISASPICSFAELDVDDVELLTRLLPPSVRVLKLAGRKAGRTTDLMANALFHLAKTVAQNNVAQGNVAQGDVAQSAGRFSALKYVRCDERIAEVVEGLAIPEVFASANTDFGFEDWPLSETTLPRHDSPELRILTERPEGLLCVPTPSLRLSAYYLSSDLSPVLPDYSTALPTFSPESPIFAFE